MQLPQFILLVMTFFVVGEPFVILLSQPFFRLGSLRHWIFRHRLTEITIFYRNLQNQIPADTAIQPRRTDISSTPYENLKISKPFVNKWNSAFHEILELLNNHKSTEIESSFFYQYTVVFLFNTVIYVFLLKEFILIVFYVFLLLSLYTYCCLCILIVCPCILNVVYVFLLLSMYSYCSSMYS